MITKGTHNKPINLQKWDFLLVIGVIIAPMTGFRIFKVGPAEVICLMWGVPYLEKALKTSVHSVLISFWGPFLTAIAIGSIIGTTFYPSECVSTGIVTYIYFAVVSVSLYAGLNLKSINEIIDILKSICILIAIWYTFLLVLSLTGSESFLGAPLWYQGIRFSGGADNPHQIALAIGPALFGNLVFAFSDSTKVRSRVNYILCSVLCVIIAQATQSSTLILAIAVSILFALFYIIVKAFKTKRGRYGASALVVLIGLMGVIVFWNQLNAFLLGWIYSDENGAGRLMIFKSIVGSLKKSFLFGLGPGTHALGGYIEYHNAFLEILAMSGVVGFIIFIVFTVRLIENVKYCPSFFMLIIPLYAYGLAGFSVRRLFFWAIITIILVLGEKNRDCNESRQVERIA